MLTSTTCVDLIHQDPPITAGAFVVEYTKRHRSTVAAALSLCVAMSSNVSYANMPTYWQGIVNCEQYVSSERNPILAAHGGFIFEDEELIAINGYLSNHPISVLFLQGVDEIVDRVYDGAAKMRLNFIDNFDNASTHLELVILSDLPIDDKFVQKDKQLFEEIRQAGLLDGLQYVVLSQG